MGMYVPRYALDLRELAVARGVDYGKYRQGIGQEIMAVPAPDEDVVTMGANAALRALEGVDRDSIRTVIFATESGVDQSKAAAIYVHRLLDLPPRCRSVEMKQACCSSTSALHFALASCALQPEHKTLLIASDIARYGLGSAGEPTQGGGAVAMVVSTEAKLLQIDPVVGYYTSDVMDFWRPNYLDEALVDGKYSIKVYKQALEQAWQHYVEEGGHAFSSFERFCYHMPFTRMAEKAQSHLLRCAGKCGGEEKLLPMIQSAQRYNREVGNCYTASLYMGLLSMLEQDPADLSGSRVGLFSYGSGCMGAFFSGQVLPGYRDFLNTQAHLDLLNEREMLSIAEYEHFYQSRLCEDGTAQELEVYAGGAFRLQGLRDHMRLYGERQNSLLTELESPLLSLGR